MRHFIKLSIVLALLVLVLPTRAQDDDLTQTYRLEAEAGVVTIDYPEGWLADDSALGLAYVALNNIPLVSGPLPTALVEIAVMPLDGLPVEFDRNADNLGEAYLSAFQELPEREIAFGQLVPVVFGDGSLEGAMIVLYQHDPQLPMAAENKIGLGLVIKVDEATLLIAEFQAVDVVADAMWPVWFAMLETMTWNSVPLVDNAVRERLGELEGPDDMRLLFATDYETLPAMPAVDSRTGYTLEAGGAMVTLPRPRGWVGEVASDEVVLRAREVPAAAIAFRWIPATEEVQSDEADEVQILSVLVERTGEDQVIDTYLFMWEDYAAASLTYRAEDGTRVGLRVGVMLNGGLLEIYAEAQPGDWMLVQQTALVAGGGLTIEGEMLSFAQLVQAIAILGNPTIEP